MYFDKQKKHQYLVIANESASKFEAYDDQTVFLQICKCHGAAGASHMQEETNQEKAKVDRAIYVHSAFRTRGLPGSTYLQTNYSKTPTVRLREGKQTQDGMRRKLARQPAAACTLLTSILTSRKWSTRANRFKSSIYVLYIQGDTS